MPREITFLNEENSLSTEEVAYWKRIFHANMKIGVEIEACYERRNSSSSIQDAMRREFVPTNNPSIFGKCGVYSVKSDGSLDNGVELCTVGRRLNFLDLYEQYKYLTGFMTRHDPYMNQRAGLHNHVLLDYGQNHSCIEKPVPGIIFKNFMQLVRKHAPELVWITSTVHINGEQTITRYNNFCKQDTLYEFPPGNRTVQQLKDKLMSTERYKFVNLNPMSVRNDLIDKFHFELRFPDGSFVPAQIAAQNILYAAMLIKAIELSEIGIMSTGADDDWEKTKMLIGALRNSNGRDRTSTPPSPSDIELIKERSIDFIKQLKPQIMQFDTHTYMVLRSLADQPLSIMLRDKTVAEVNEYFSTFIQNAYSCKSEEHYDLIKIINVMKVTGANSKLDWCMKAGTLLNTTGKEIEAKLFRLNMIKPVDFDMELGIVYFK